MKRIGFVTIGLGGQVPEPGRSDGAPPGTTGYALPQISEEQAVLALETAVSVEDVDHRLEAGLTLLCVSPPAVEYRDFIADDGQFDCEVTGVSMRFADDTARQMGLDMVRAAELPARRETLARELVRLCVVSAGRKGSDLDRDAYLAAMLEELAEYPADVALDALRAMRRQSKWLPTAAEIHEFCGWRAKRRERLIRAARSAPAGLEGI